MKCAVIGLGVQGKKRARIAGADVSITVDSVDPSARFRRIEDAPLADFDAALVCTPDGAKVEILRYLLAHKKHVLVEKPLTADHTVLRELGALSRAHHVALYTAYNHRFEPHFVHMRGVIQSGRLGKLHLLRWFYGNGTAREVQKSPWRDAGAGVLDDLGSHILDTLHFFFGEPVSGLTSWSFDRVENKSFDHVLFGRVHATDRTPALVLEATMLSWRNTFTLDVIGERGSAHVNGLCKWGPSVFTVRDRILPSGKPNEESVTLEQPDPTWALEYAHFQKLCATGGSNVENDIGIAEELRRLLEQTK